MFCEDSHQCVAGGLTCLPGTISSGWGTLQKRPFALGALKPEARLFDSNPSQDVLESSPVIRALCRPFTVPFEGGQV